MYCLPSASQKYGPDARSMNRGVPPTERNARTGEFTPPGMVFWARSKRASFLDMTGPALKMTGSAGEGCGRWQRSSLDRRWDRIRQDPAGSGGRSRLQEIKMKLYRSRLASVRDAPSRRRNRKDCARLVKAGRVQCPL